MLLLYYRQFSYFAHYLHLSASQQRNEGNTDWITLSFVAFISVTGFLSLLPFTVCTDPLRPLSVTLVEAFTNGVIMAVGAQKVTICDTLGITCGYGLYLEPLTIQIRR